MDLNEMIQDMKNKGLIEIIRVPRSEKLATLIRSTKANFYRPLHWVLKSWEDRN